MIKGTRSGGGLLKALW